MKNTNGGFIETYLNKSSKRDFVLIEGNPAVETVVNLPNDKQLERYRRKEYFLSKKRAKETAKHEERVEKLLELLTLGGSSSIDYADSKDGFKSFMEGLLKATALLSAFKISFGDFDPLQGLKKVFDTLKVGGDALLERMGVYDFFNRVGDYIKNSPVGRYARKLDEATGGFFSRVGNALSAMTIGEFATLLKSKVSSFFSYIGNTFDTSSFEEYAGKLKDSASKLLTYITNLFKEETRSEELDRLKAEQEQKIKSLKDNLKDESLLGKTKKAFLYGDDKRLEAIIKKEEQHLKTLTTVKKIHDQEKKEIAKSEIDRLKQINKARIDALDHITNKKGKDTLIEQIKETNKLISRLKSAGSKSKTESKSKTKTKTDSKTIKKIDMDAYYKALAKVESGGYKNPYNVKNSIGYVGKYQFGKSTALPFLKKLGAKWSNFRNNKPIQEKVIRMFTDNNVTSISSRLKGKREMTPLDLWVAHNQGMGGWNEIVTKRGSGKPIPKNIMRNMKNNVPNNMKNGLTRDKFLDYWEKKFKQDEIMVNEIKKMNKGKEESNIIVVDEIKGLEHGRR